MENKLSHLMVFTLSYEELAPFFYFLSLSSLPPSQLKDVCDSRKGTVKCVISIPVNIDPDILKRIWHAWKRESLDEDYAVLN